MTPGQHFIVSWVVANAKPLDRRSRVCITAAGLIPDLDGLGVVVDSLRKYWGYSTSYYYEDYHHILCHNLFFGLLLSAILAWACRKRMLVFLLCLLAFHLHLLGDLIGSRGPDGFYWPIPYLYPLTSSFTLTWSGQWQLSGWQNSAIGVTFFLMAVVLARYRRVTFFEFFSLRFESMVREAAYRRGFFKPDRQTPLVTESSS